MAGRESKESGWIVQHMERLERESKDWPAWKRDELEDLLERNETGQQRSSDDQDEL